MAKGPAKRRRRTSTSAFGVAGRISHDASAYYARAMSRPVGMSTESGGEQPIPADVLDSIFCHSSEDMHELPDRSVHLMVTSPPYNVGKEYDEDLTLDEYRGLLRRVLEETHRVLVPGGRACVNVANLGRKPYIPLHAYVIEDAASAGFQMRGEIIWDKDDSASPSTAWGSWMSASNPTLRDTHEYILVFQKPPFRRPKRDGQESTIKRDDFLEWTKSVWTFGPERAARVDHPAPFPVELPERLINLLTYKGEVVLDPFIGSGTTAVAALCTHRHFVGYDIDIQYHAAALRRIAQERHWHISRPAQLQFTGGGSRGILPTRRRELLEIIVERECAAHLANGIDDATLSEYFDACFDRTVDALQLYPTWACMGCLDKGLQTVRRGVKPELCPVCGSGAVYEVGTFQGRSTRVGRVFPLAVRRAVRELAGVDLSPVPRGTRTHDFEYGRLAIAARGSMRRIRLPDGSVQTLHGPGMTRSDTHKKAAANAQTLKRSHPAKSLIVVTNATRHGPISRANNDIADIAAILDMTKRAGIEELHRLLRNA